MFAGNVLKKSAAFRPPDFVALLPVTSIFYEALLDIAVPTVGPFSKTFKCRIRLQKNDVCLDTFCERIQAFLPRAVLDVSRLVLNTSDPYKQVTRN